MTTTATTTTTTTTMFDDDGNVTTIKMAFAGPSARDQVENAGMPLLEKID